MTTSTVAGKPLLAGEVTQPFLGAWHAEVSASSETALTGKVTVKIDDVPYVGTVIPGRSGVHGGRAAARIVGGNGGLSKELDVLDYAGPAGAKFSLVLADILRDAGEKLSSTSDPAILSKVLTKWHRIAGPANHALTRLCEEVGANWRVLSNGEIWVGVTAWAKVNPTHVLIDEDWVGGIITIATEAPSLEPGTTFLDRRIDTVVHVLTPTSLRTEAHVSSASSALNRFTGYLRRQIDYSRIYPATVSTQNDDETLQLVPDDARVKGSGLDRVQIRRGIPGITSIKVPNGTRCDFTWEAGDPARPIVVGFEAGAAILVQFGNAAQPIGRQGDMVAVTISADVVAQIAAALLITISPPGATLNPLSIALLLAKPIVAYGMLTTGNPLFKV